MMKHLTFASVLLLSAGTAFAAGDYGDKQGAAADTGMGQSSSSMGQSGMGQDQAGAGQGSGMDAATSANIDQSTDPMGQQDQAFTEADQDQDQALSQDEFVNSGIFDGLDQDADGALTAQEFPGDQQQMSQWDEDGNQELSDEEFYQGMFSQADQDGDSQLSDQEFQTAFMQAGGGTQQATGTQQPPQG